MDRNELFHNLDAYVTFYKKRKKENAVCGKV